MDDKRAALRSGQLAKLVGVSADTLRHYERIGLIPRAPRTAAGYRMYSPELVERVKTVRRAQQLGFTLSELAEIFRIRDRGRAPCARVLAMTEQKLATLGQRVRELQRARRSMQALLRHWRAQMDRTGPGEKALLLESLNGKPELAGLETRRLSRRIRG